MWYEPNDKNNIYVYRGMSSQEYYNWLQRGFIPKGKDVVSEGMVGWAVEHSQFGKNDILVGFYVPKEALNIKNKKGHYTIKVPIPISADNIQIVNGNLKSKEDIDQLNSDLDAAKQECLQYLKPGVVLYNKASGSLKGLEILSVKNKQFVVKRLYRKPSNELILKIEKKISEIDKQLELLKAHIFYYNFYHGDIDKLQELGYNTNTPNFEELEHLKSEKDDLHLQLKDMVDAEMQNSNERTDTLSAIHFPNIFQFGAIAELPDGTEIDLPFDKWFENIMVKQNK